MKARKVLASIVVTVGIAAVSTAWAQAPAGSTGQCKDNTYTSSASKRGACKGHGGVKEWYAAEKSEAKASKGSATTESKTKMEPAPATAAAPAAAPAEKPAATKSASTAPAPRSTAAAGGGAGKVWVNTATNVYHCQGTKWYGKTKQGEYMSESDAKAKGAHADHGKACG